MPKTSPRVRRALRVLFGTNPAAWRKGDGQRMRALMGDSDRDVDGIAARLRVLRFEHDAALTTIRNDISANRELSDEGRQKTLQREWTKLRDQSMTELASIRSDMKQSVERITAAVDARLPQPQSGVEGLLQRQAAWQRVKQLLDSGTVQLPSQLIKQTTDVETLWALTDELPTWARSHGTPQDGADRLKLQAVAQIARVAGVDELAGDFEARQEAEAEVARLTPMLDLAEADFSGSPTSQRHDGINAAVQGDLAHRAARAWAEPVVIGDDK